VTTIGFREVQEFGVAEKVFTIGIALLGVGVVLYTLSTLMGSAVEGQLASMLGRRRMDRRIRRMEGHVVLCGWGRVGKAIAKDLTAKRRPFVVVEADATRVAGVEYPLVLGDATDDDVLRQAGIERASALVATLDTDAANLFLTLSAKALRPDLFVVARAREEATIDKLTRAGADRVVNPQQIGGARMAAFLTQPHVAEFVDVVMHDRTAEFRLAEVPLPAGSPLAGLTLEETGVRERTGALVLALRTSTGEFVPNPRRDSRLEPGHILIAVGTPDELRCLAELAGG
jgi:voltage-gated potassium channel